MSLWLFNVYLDVVMKEAQGRVVDVEILLMGKRRIWKVPVLLFAGNTILLSEDEWKLQGLVNIT